MAVSSLQLLNTPKQNRTVWRGSLEKGFPFPPREVLWGTPPSFSGRTPEGMHPLRTPLFSIGDDFTRVLGWKSAKSIAMMHKAMDFICVKWRR